MKKRKIRNLRFTGYSVRHKELIGLKCILFCTYENKEYAEIVLEKAENFENEELLWYNRILFVESRQVRKNKQNRYVIFYQETKGTTIIHAESMELYPSSYFIGEIGRYAVIEWNKRHICLPSLMVAMLMLETNKGKKLALGIKELARERTDNLAAWKEEGTLEDNGKSLWGWGNYILAAQYLQKAVMLNFEDKNFEKLLIATIEENRLMRFDF